MNATLTTYRKRTPREEADPREWIKLVSDFDWTLVQLIKSRIPSSGRQWRPELPNGYGKFWLVEERYKRRLLNLLSDCDFTISDCTDPPASLSPSTEHFLQELLDQKPPDQRRE